MAGKYNSAEVRTFERGESSSCEAVPSLLCGIFFDFFYSTDSNMVIYAEIS